MTAKMITDIKSTTPGQPDTAETEEQPPAPRDTAGDIARMSEEARSRSSALSERLMKSRSKKHDDALREEIAVIAANMVAMTALKEGSRSPILSLLPTPAGEGGGERQSLADRSSDLLSDQPPPA